MPSSSSSSSSVRSNRSSLYNAIYNEDWNKTRRLIMKKNNEQKLRKQLEYVGWGGRNALHRALYRNVPMDVLTPLLSSSSSRSHDDSPSLLLAKDCSGWTPLHLALVYVSDEKVMMTIDACPQAAGVKDFWEQLPLHRAVEHNRSVGIIRRLMVANPSGVTMPQKNGETPLEMLFSRWDAGLSHALARNNGYDDQIMMDGGGSIMEWDVKSSDKQIRKIRWIYEVTVLLVGATLHNCIAELPIRTFFSWLQDYQIAQHYPESFIRLFKIIKKEHKRRQQRKRETRKCHMSAAAILPEDDNDESVRRNIESILRDEGAKDNEVPVIKYMRDMPVKDSHSFCTPSLVSTSEASSSAKSYFDMYSSISNNYMKQHQGHGNSRIINASMDVPPMVVTDVPVMRFSREMSRGSLSTNSSSSSKERDNKSSVDTPEAVTVDVSSISSLTRDIDASCRIRSVNKEQQQAFPIKFNNKLSIGTTGATRQAVVQDKQQSNKVKPQPPTQITRVIIAGGDIASLTTALLLLDYGRRYKLPIDIRIYEPRWEETDGTGYDVQWSHDEDFLNRRYQVVTLESHAWSHFPSHVKRALFDGVEIWPEEPKSTDDISITLGALEDKLLEVIKNEIQITCQEMTNKQSHELLPNISLYGGKDKGYLDKTKLEKIVRKEGGFDFLILADNRSEDELCPHVFGNRSPFPEDIELNVKEQVLSLFFTLVPQDDDHSNNNAAAAKVLSHSDMAKLSASQRRFSTRFFGPNMGFLDMWLTPEEAEEVGGMDSNLNVVNADQCGCSCMYFSCANTKQQQQQQQDCFNYECKIHNSYFIPSLPVSRKFCKLWPRIEDGLSLFDIPLSSVRAFTKYQSGPFLQRANFMAPLGRQYLSKGGNKRRPPMAFTISDAAFTVSYQTAHRAINTSLITAVSLARTLTKAAQTTSWSTRNFLAHNALMYSFQDKDVRINSLARIQGHGDEDDYGDYFTVADKIKEGISLHETIVNNKDPQMSFHKDIVKQRICQIVSEERMITSNSNDAAGKDNFNDNLQDRLDQVSNETICVLSKCGGWINSPANDDIVSWSDFARDNSHIIPEPLWDSKLMSEVKTAVASSSTNGKKSHDVRILHKMLTSSDDFVNGTSCTPS